MPAFNNSGYQAREDLDGGSKSALAAGIIAELRKVPWTEAQQYGYSTGTLAGVPSNNATVTIGSLTYTFKTVIDNPTPRHVLIGGTVAECIDNLEHAINDDGTGEGTLYSNSTTAHPDVTAAPVDGDDTQITITAQTIGLAGNDIATSGTLTWGYTATSNGGSGFTCPKTPAGLSFRVFVYYVASGDDVYIEVVGPNDSFGASANPGYLTTAASRYFCMITHKYGFWLGIDHGADGDGCAFQCGTIRVFDTMLPTTITWASSDTPQAITAIADTTPVEVTIAGHGLVDGDKVYVQDCSISALNSYWDVTYIDDNTISLDGSVASGAGSDGELGKQIQVATDAAHELVTGDTIFITGATGNTAINGAHTVTVISDHNVWLNNSIPDGGYAPDPGEEALAANRYQVAECFWMNHCQFSLTGGDLSFRGGPNTNGTTSTQMRFYQRINQYTVSRQGGSNHTGHAELAYRAVGVYYIGQKAIIFRPLLSLDQDVGGSSHQWVGELWDAVMINRDHSQDLKVSFQGYNWQQWFTSSTVSLFLAYGES